MNKHTKSPSIIFTSFRLHGTNDMYSNVYFSSSPFRVFSSYNFFVWRNICLQKNQYEMRTEIQTKINFILFFRLLYKTIVSLVWFCFINGSVFSFFYNFYGKFILFDDKTKRLNVDSNFYCPCKENKKTLKVR